MKAALFVVLLAAFAHAGAQSGVLVSSLPEDVNGERPLEVARQVLAASGWTVAPDDRATLNARKDNSYMRVFLSDGKLRFSDQSVRPRGTKQREHREEGPQLTAVPQAEIDSLRADLVAAFEGRLPLAGLVAVPTAPGQMLIAVPARADPQEVMKVARNAFIGRRWELKDDDDGFIADIRGVQESATLRVFLADGALRFIDRSTDRKGGKTQAPERWLNNLRADLRTPISLLAPRAERNPSARAATPDGGSAAARLTQLKTLLDRGLITQTEYDAKRAEILKGL